MDWEDQKMTRKYSDCYFCGGSVEEKFLPREIRWEGQLFIFEDVPMGVCVQCGEKFLVPAVAKTIDRAIREGKRPPRTIRVPVYDYNLI
jgi:YgiT-type zinc finger domain-containing protein